MNTLQIDKILFRSPITRKHYLGCFPADRIPSSIAIYPACMCVNTDPGYSQGEHWVAIFIRSSHHAEYFDSLSEWPPQSPHIASYLKRYRNIERNGGASVLPLQNPLASTCGAHVCYFLYTRCMGKSLKAITHKLQKMGSRADHFVCSMLKKCIFKNK
jgi:hypothetical protein